MADALPRGLLARAGFLAAYAVLWLLADIAGTLYVNGSGLEVWYVNAALDVVLFLYVGWGWWPLPVVLYAVSFLIVPEDRYGPIGINIIAQAPYELLLALFTKLTVDLCGVRFPLQSVRDVAWFAGILAVLGSIVSNAAFVGIFSALDPATFPWSTFPAQFLRGSVADTTAIMVLAPVILQLLAWRQPVATEAGARELHLTRAFFIGLAAMGVISVMETFIGARIGRTLGEFTLVPLAFLSITFGMRGAALALLVADAAASFARFALHLPIESLIAAQGYLVASGLLALVLGAAAVERQRLLNRLAHAANYDQLTDLPNARQLNDWLRACQGQTMALAVLDIAAMRILNDGVGRESVDHLLVDVSQRLRQLPERFIARIGAGEFAIAARNGETSGLIEEVQRQFDRAFDIHGTRMFVDAAIGAGRTDSSEEPRDVLRRAELATRRAKTSATRTAVYSAEAEPANVPLLVVDLHEALERDHFTPFYQPIYRHNNGAWTLAGAEVLLRWQHPRRGLLMPADFLSLLERLAICNAVGWGILGKSLTQAASWRSVIPDFNVWVNFFPRQVFDPRCVERVMSAIEAAGVAADALVVEITETVVASDDFDIAHVVKHLRSLGVQVAIDDFGTGGSSLARVREVPANFLKIDRSFVIRSDVDPKALSVAKTVVRLANELGMDALAEGVENAPQVAAMIAIGCRLGQGYALGHPMPAELFEQALSESKTA